MKAYKGFNKDMTCRGFQFKEGETYHEDNAELCRSGFHACEDPLDCFRCYEPVESVYHEVELDEISNEKITGYSMICGKTIKIGAKLDITEICKAHFEYIKSKTKNDKKAQDCSALAAQDYSALEAQNCSALAAQSSSSLVARHCSALAAQDYSALVGRSGSALAAQDHSALLAQDDSSLAAQSSSSLVAQNYSVLAARSWSVLEAQYGSILAAQDWSTLAAQDESVLAARDDSTLAAGRNSIIAAFNSKVKGKKGTLIALANRVYDDEAREWIISDFKAGIVDGKIIKEDTWYTVKNGEFVEAEADE